MARQGNGTAMLPVSQKKKIKKAADIYSAEEFQDVINRERSRIDRSGSTFSLVLFKAVNGHGFDHNSRKLLKAICRRKRFVDEMGWYDDKRVAVLLPSTSQEGAEKFAVDIENKTHSRYMYPLFSVLAYTG